MRLSVCAEQLFNVSYTISEAALERWPVPEPEEESELMIQASALRAECALIRSALEEHRMSAHQVQPSFAESRPVR